MANTDHMKVKEISISEQKCFDGKPFPLVLSPQDVNQYSIKEWCAWVKNNTDFIRKNLLTHCAVLFRGFPIDTPDDFDDFVTAFGFPNFPYVGGAAPRTCVVGNVFTSNEAPPSELIPFHHEMAQVPDFPKHLFFYCDIEPGKGGETPLVVSNAAYKKIKEEEPEFVDRLEKEGVCYTRVLPNGDDPSSPIGRGWQSTFLTQSKSVAEERAIEQGTKFEWLEGDCLKTTTKVLPGIRVDPRTGKSAWFNSIIAAYLGWQDCRNDRLKAVTFPNGDLMPPKAMATVERVLNDMSIAFAWKKRDVVCVDNRQALHGRRSFVPPRRILASLCKE